MRRLLLAASLVAGLGAPVAALARDAWEGTIERVSRGVVALRVTGTRAFDTEAPGVSVATGFVVDAERGLILTNRHVVRPGPIQAEAVFLNHERVPVWPVYRDPVHDFGFFRYDPASVRFMRPEPLALVPEAARVGTEFRVIGNDAGEKLSILAGTLARLDREAPSYGKGNYGDFNTFYIQASSGISGGSSGSPVVDRSGQVVALVAGGNRQASTSFFLPLQRVVYALARLRAGEAVARGTLQAVFRHASYDELGRLGLASASEARMRGAHPEAHGLLVVAEVLPGGPAAGLLEPGDVALSLEGRDLLDFTRLEAVLDAAVGRELRLGIERGGVAHELLLLVQDLHAVTPAAYIEFSGGVLHPLSLQLARSHGVAVSGVVLAARGYAFSRAGIAPRAVIREIGGVALPDLAALEGELARLPDGERVRVRWSDLSRPDLPQESVLRIDRRWFAARHCTRDDSLGRFVCRELPPPPAPQPVVPASARLHSAGPGPSEELARSLVSVSFDVPYGIDGVQGTAFTGAGLVVDAARGLVLVDRDTVPVTLGDVEIGFGGSLTLDGRVRALHPEHNLALVAYDPAQLGDTPVETATLCDAPLAVGDAVWLVTLSEQQQLLAQQSFVARVDAPQLPLPRVPRFRETNLDLIGLTEVQPGVGGVLADRKGRVRALWASFSTEGERGPSAFFAGIPAEQLQAWLGDLEDDEPVAWRMFGVELAALALADARERGLPAEQAAELEDRQASAPRVLVVRRLHPDSPAAAALQVGDLLLRVNGQPVTRFREVERAAQAEHATLTVARGGTLHEFELTSALADAEGTRDVLLWAGALLQPPPVELATQWGASREGVYVAGTFRGTPAERHRLRPTLRILAVDGQATRDLAAFRTAVAALAHGDTARLQVIDLEGRSDVLAVELDQEDWPAVSLTRTPTGWERSAAAEPAP